MLKYGGKDLAHCIDYAYMVMVMNIVNDRAINNQLFHISILVVCLSIHFL